MSRARHHQPAPSRGDRRDEAGFTLVEFIVASGILTVLLAVFAVSIQHMASSAIRVQSVADSSTQARQAVDRLSRQLSYASAVNTPVRVGDDWYLEFQTDAAPDGGDATCTQWRLLGASDELQMRQWSLVTAVPTAWSTIAQPVVNDPTTQQPFTVFDVDTAFTLLRVGIDVRIQNRTGPVLQNQGQYTVRNSADAPSPSPTAVCTQVGRP